MPPDEEVERVNSLHPHLVAREPLLADELVMHDTGTVATGEAVATRSGVSTSAETEATGTGVPEIVTGIYLEGTGFAAVTTAVSEEPLSLAAIVPLSAVPVSDDAELVCGASTAGALLESDCGAAAATIGAGAESIALEGAEIISSDAKTSVATNNSAINICLIFPPPSSMSFFLKQALNYS